MRIISWNIHNRASLWEEVASLDADIALLQEAPKPPKSLSSKLNIVSNNDWYTAKGRKASFRPWRTTIIALSDNIDIKGIAHITGGGLLENIPRILPDNCGVKIQKKVWPTPPVFNVMQHIGKVDENEMYRTFNMGIGLVFVVD